MSISPRATRLIVFTAVALGGAAVFWRFGPGAPPADEASGTDPAFAVGGEVIAVVNGQPILEGEWQSRVGDVTPEQSRRLLQGEVRRKAILSAAEEAGYAEREEVRKRAEEAMLALYLREAIDDRVASLALTEEELEAYLADHPMSPPRPLRRAAIIRRQMAEDEDAADIEGQLLAAREAALATNGPIAHFGSEAARLSDHRGSSSRGGVLGYFQAERFPNDEIPAAVHAALWALNAPGEISGVVEENGVFYLVRFVDEHVRPGQDPESQRALIAERLLREKRRVARQALLAGIETEVGVSIAPDWQAQPIEPQTPQPPPSPIATQAATSVASANGS